MGLKAEIPQDVEGTSFAPIITGKEIKKPSSQLYFMVNGQLSKKSHKMNDLTLAERGIRTQRYTLFMDRFTSDSTSVFLWDRKTDPYQLVNIADQNPMLVNKLIDEELKPWLQKTKDPWLNGLSK